MNTSQLNQLQKQGKIQNFTVNKRQQTYKDSSTKPRKELPVIPATAKRSEEKGWMHWNILYFCNKHSFELIEEFQFDKQRKWKADFAIPAMNVLIEYEGLMSAKSRHTTPLGFTHDTDKYNAAVKQGWKVLRYSVFNYNNAIHDLKEILK